VPLVVEQLEDRVLLAIPIAPFDLDLLAGGDSGSSNSDDITNDSGGTVELIAETDSTVAVYNAGYLDDATDQNDIFFYESGGSVMIEAEKGAIAGNMQFNNTQGVFQGTGYVEETTATAGSPEDGGTVTYTFYVTTEDDYYVHGRCYFPSGSQNSLFINLDDQWDPGENGPSLWSNTYNSWHFATAATLANGGTDQTWHLTVGWHTLEVHGREQWSKLDRFIISNNAGAPGDPGPAESVTYETFQYTFGAGEFIGSNYGTNNSITATAQNGEGTGPASNPLVITYDTGTITPATPDLDPASDTGSSNTDNITNDTTATFTGNSGSIEGNSTLWIRVGGIDQRSTTANADGSYSITLQIGDLVEGANAVDMYYIDLAGNTSTDSVDLTVTLDTTAVAPAAAPDLDAGSDTGLDNSDDYTNDTTPTFTGGAGVVPANATLWLRVATVNQASATAAGDGSYSITLPDGILSEGNNDIDIIYLDPAGNASGDSPDLTITLDTISDKPGMPDLTSDAANDTGSSQVDNITRENNCEISGVAVANGTIHIRVNGTEVNTAASNGAGNWSYTFVNGDLAEGANTVNVTAEDSLGNPESAYSDSLIVTLDTNIATPAPPDLRAASDTGNDTDNITSDDAAWFDGFAEPGATVQLFVGAVGKDADTADAATGAWSIQLNNGDLIAGANNITLQATDPAGNTATSGILIVTFDDSGTVPNAPKLLASSDSGSSNNDQITNIAAAVVYGSVAGGNPVEADSTVHIRTNKNVAGWVEVGTTLADSSGNWSYTFDGVDDLGEGNNLVEVYIVDLADETSANSADLTIVLDTTANAPAAAPDLDAASDSGSSNSDNITNDTTPTFTGGAGSVEANATVWVRVDGSNIRSTTAAGDGSYSIPLNPGDLTAGTHTVDVIYIDIAGNTSGDSTNLSVMLDTTAAAPLTAPDLDVASDTGTSSSDDLTNDTTATFTGNTGSVEANSTVCLRIDGGDTRSTTANADGSYSITLLAGDLSEGTNDVDIYYIDPAGNSSGDSPDLTVTLDTTIADPVKPDMTDATDTGSSDNDDITAETRPTIRGNAGSVEGSSAVHIYLYPPGGPDAEIATVTAAADGSWSYTFTSANPLEEGANVIHIVAVDSAGNISNDSPDLTIMVDFDAGAEAAPDLDAASDTGTANDDNITADNTPTVTGICPVGAEIKIRINESNILSFTDNDGNDGNGVAGQWSYTFAGGVLNEGVNTIDFLTIDTNNQTGDWSLDLVISLDTSIEQPTQPDLSTADDSGSSSGDNITNVTNPTITGTAEANSIITIDINAGTQTDTTAAGANGLWSYIITNSWLNEGANTIFVTATDGAGNVSANSSNFIITLDTTINQPSTPDLTAATDTGASNTDNITSHVNPRIIGTADPNSMITIRLDPNGVAAVLGTTFADGAGNWSFTFASSDLAEGDNIIDVLATDSAGNTNDSTELTITIETAINTPVGLDLTDASDLGDLNNDDLTSLTTATITGTADSSSTIYVRVNGTVVGSTTSDVGGNWTYTFDGVDDLIEGTNIIDAYAEDDVGNVSTYSTDLIIVLDTSVAIPAVPDLIDASDSGASSVDNYTSETNPTIAGSCEVGATILIHLNGNDSFDTITDDDSDGLWSYTFAGGLNASSSGTDNSIKIAQRDAAGNAGAYGATLTVTLDDAADTPSTPDLLAITDSGDADDDNLTNQAQAIITGTIEANSSLQIFIDQGGGPNLIDTISETLIASGTWTYTLSMGHLAEGTNQITVIATDKADNVSASSAALIINFDITVNQPGLPDLVPASDTGDADDDDVTFDETPTFIGACDPNCHVTIRVDGESINTIDADAGGNWTYTFAQGEIQTGVHQIDVVVVDPAGNQSVPSDNLTLWLNVEPTQPAAPNLQYDSDSGSIHTDNLTNVTTPIIDGKADPLNTVHVYVDGNLIGDAPADANGFWEYTFADGALSEAENVVTIITEDSSGKRSAVSYSLSITIDTTAPDAPIPDLAPGSDTGTSDTDNLTSDETATIQGITEPSAWIDLYHSDTFIAQLIATTNGAWSYTFAPGVMVEGDNLIYVILTDVAGNISVPSDVLNVVLDMDQGSADVPNLDPDSDTGLSDGDGITNDPAAGIFGTVKPNSSVAILVSGAQIANVSADENGLWEYSFTENQLTEGLNLIEVISTDPVGNSARSATLDMILDTTGPVVYNYFPAGIHVHTTNNIELYLSGDDLDSLAAADISGYSLYGSGGDGTFDDGNEWFIPISSATVDDTTGLVQLNTVITLTDDTYRLQIDPAISLRDEAGNPAQLNVSSQHSDGLNNNQPLEIIFEIDTAGPPAPTGLQLDPASDSGSDNNDNITNIDNPLVYMTADPEVTVEIICNGRSAGFANETTPGQYQLVIDGSLIREGENLLLARAYDWLGNSSELSELQSFIYDTQGPEVAAVVVEPVWLNLGPTQVSVVFDQTDMDPASVLLVENFQCIAAGGDGTFDDGNEISIPIEAVTHEQSTHTVVLTLPQTVTGNSELTPDAYRLIVLGDSEIADAAGNRISESASQQFRVVQAETIHRNERYQFTSQVGAQVTVSLKGAGDAIILLGEAIDSSNTIEKIILSNTDENTRLKISSQKGTDNITIGQILGDSLIKAINARSAEITGQINISASLSQLTLGSIDDGVTLNLTSDSSEENGKNGMRIKTGVIGQAVEFDITGHLRSFAAAGYLGGSITADSANTIQITQGSLGADLDMQQGSLQSLQIRAGDLSGNLEVAERIGNIKVAKGQIDSNINANAIDSIHAAQLNSSTIRAAQGIQSVKAQSGSYSQISAGTDIAKIRFGESLDNTTAAAGRNINSLSIKGDAVDNLFLAGADLGEDAKLNGIEDQFSDGNIDKLFVRGVYYGSVAAAAVNPGADLTYFTADDAAASQGHIAKIRFGKTSLEETIADSPFGLTASGSLTPFKLQGQLFQAPLQLNQFHLTIIP
jgi:large repetitive protein